MSPTAPLRPPAIDVAHRESGPLDAQSPSAYSLPRTPAADATPPAAARAPRVGCGAAIVVDGRILLLRRSTEPEAGAWGIPGGKVDPFETVPAAVAREIAEELGIAIEPRDLLCVVDQIDARADIHWVAPVYLVTRYDGVPRRVEPEKHAALAWFPLDALPAPLTTPTEAALAALAARP